MQDNSPQLEFQKNQLATALGQAAEALRNVAAVAEGFASLLHGISFATPGQTTTAMSSLGMLQSFNQMLAAAAKGQLSMNGAHPSNQQSDPSMNEDGPAPDTDTVPKAKRKRGDPKPEKVKKEKKEKKYKDPNAPKRPQSAYLMYQNEVRGDMRKRFPDVSYNQILVQIAAIWKDMPAEEKRPYHDAVLREKEEYLRLKGMYDSELAAATAAVSLGSPDVSKAVLSPEAAAPTPVSGEVETSEAESPAPHSPSAFVSAKSDTESSDSDADMQEGEGDVEVGSSDDSDDDDDDDDEKSNNDEDEVEEDSRPPQKKSKTNAQSAKPASKTLSTPVTVVKAAAAAPVSSPAQHRSKEKEKEKREKKKRSKDDM